MKLLLDTHAFLWFINGDERLSNRARSHIEAKDADLYLSIASLWEISIKVSLGKQRIPTSVVRLIEVHVLGNGIQILPIQPDHLEALATLPFHHRDPFDRLLISQSLVEGMALLTRDPSFEDYGIERAW